MNLIAIQVVGEGSFALPPFYKPFASIEPIQWKCYGGSCSCVFQREIRFFGNKLEECQGSCETKTAFWTTVSNHLMGLDNFKNNLQLLLGNQFTMTEVKAFQDQYGELVKWGGRVKGDGVQGGDQEKLIQKLYRITFQEISRGSTGDDRSPTRPGTNLLDGDNTQLPPPYSALGETEPTLDNLNASIQKSIHGEAKKRYWQLIFNHVKNYVANNVGDNLLRIVAKLLKANPSPDELEHWVEIVKCIKDNQLPMVDQLAVLNPYAGDLENWRAVNNCGGTLA